jgi:hypothetical protein
VCRSERRDGAGRAVTSLLPARRIPGCGDAHLSLTMSPRQHLPFPAPAVLSAPSALPLPSHPASTSAPHSSRTPVPPHVHTAAAPSSRALPYPSHPVTLLCSRHAPVLPHNLVPCAPDDAHTIHARLLHTKAAQIDRGILASLCTRLAMLGKSSPLPLLPSLADPTHASLLWRV